MDTGGSARISTARERGSGTGSDTSQWKEAGEMAETETNARIEEYSQHKSRLLQTTQYYRQNVQPTGGVTVVHTPMVYYRELLNMVCAECMTVVGVDKWRQHMEQKHRQMVATVVAQRATSEGSDEKSERAKVIEEIERQVAGFELREIGQVELRNGELYIECLPVTFGNYKCRECAVVGPSEKRIRVHYNETHGRRARGSNVRADYVIRGVPLQDLGNFAKKRKYYVMPKLPVAVEREGETVVASSSESETESDGGEVAFVTDAMAKSYIKAYEDGLEAQKLEDAEKDTETINEKLLNRFLRSSRMTDWLKGKDRDVLTDMVRDAGDCRLDALLELELEVTSSNVATVVRQAHDECIDVLPRGFRQELQTADRSKGRKEMKDLIKRINPSFELKHMSTLVLFVLRVQAVNDEVELEMEDAGKVGEYYKYTSGLVVGKEVRGFASELLELDGQELDWKENGEYTRRFNELAFGLIVALLGEKIAHSTVENRVFRNLTVNYAFCYMLDRETKQPRKVNYCTGMIGRLVFGFRVAFVGYTRRRELDAADYATAAEQLGTESVQMMHRLLSDNSQNCFEELLMMAAYGAKLNLDATADDFQLDEPAPDEIAYNGTVFDIGAIRRLMRQLLAKLETMMRDKLLMVGNLEGLGVPFGSIVDTSSLNKAGDSLSDSVELRRYKGWFVRQLCARDSPYKRRMVSRYEENGKPVLKLTSATKWIGHFNEFAAVLAIAINVTTGGPMRVTELTTLLYKNSSVNQRSLKYNRTEQVFVLTSTYHKSLNVTRRQVQNVRITPPALTRLLVYWIVFVLPFRDWMMVHVFDKAGFSNGYLLPRGDRALGAEVVRTKMQQEAKGVWEHKLTVQVWRKLINYIVKRKISADVELDDGDSEGEEAAAEDLIEDVQANRSTRVSLNHYFANSLELDNFRNMAEFKQLAQFSHKYFNYFGLLEGAAVSVGLLEHGGVTGPSRQLASEQMLVANEELRLSLRQLLKSKDAHFTSRQQEFAVGLVDSRQPVVTYVNRTGSGKSLAYLLPAHRHRDRLYAVVTPRVSLQADLLRRCGELGLRAGVLSDRFNFETNLLFVAAEEMDGKLFDKVLAQHRAHRRPVTVFFDEAHLFVLEERFRPKMRDAPAMAKLGASLVFLTATLPRPLQQQLERKFHCEHSNVMVRGDSNRPDVEWKRVYYRPVGVGDGRVEAVRRVLAEVRAEREDGRGGGGGGKVLVFVASKAWGEELSRALEIEFVHAGRAEYGRVVGDFVAEEANWALITTSVIEVGLDLKAVRWTVSVEPIHGLMAVVQSAGRIRRRGRAYVVCAEPTKQQIRRWQGEIGELVHSEEAATGLKAFERLDRLFYQRFVAEDECLRTPVSLFLDNRVRQCVVGADECCSVCREREEVKDSLRQAELRARGQRERAWLGLEAALFELKDQYCLKCLLDEYCRPGSFMHAVGDCGRLAGDERVAEALRRAHEARLRPGSACEGCLLPKNLCTKVSRQGMVPDGECLFGETCWRLLAVLAVHRSNASKSFEALEGADDGAGVVRALLRPVELAGLRTVALMDVLAGFQLDKVVETQEGAEEGSAVDVSVELEDARPGSSVGGSAEAANECEEAYRTPDRQYWVERGHRRLTVPAERLSRREREMYREALIRNDEWDKVAEESEDWDSSDSESGGSSGGGGSESESDGFEETVASSSGGATGRKRRVSWGESGVQRRKIT